MEKLDMQNCSRKKCGVNAAQAYEIMLRKGNDIQNYTIIYTITGLDKYLYRLSYTSFSASCGLLLVTKNVLLMRNLSEYTRLFLDSNTEYSVYRHHYTHACVFTRFTENNLEFC